MSVEHTPEGPRVQARARIASMGKRSGMASGSAENSEEETAAITTSTRTHEQDGTSYRFLCVFDKAYIPEVQGTYFYTCQYGVPVHPWGVTSSYCRRKNVRHQPVYVRVFKLTLGVSLHKPDKKIM